MSDPTMKKKLMATSSRIACLVVFALIFSLISGIAEGVPQIILDGKEAVVTILINDKDGHRLARATGFIIDPAGIIVTNYHVISEWIEDPDNALSVKLENSSYYAIEKLLATDKKNDLAIFKVDGTKLPALKLAKDYKPTQGDSVVVIGSPSGLEATVSDGIISSVRWKEGFIQITARAAPGNSGSPLINSQGEVIGVVCCRLKRGNGVSFAIPVVRVSNLFNKWKKQKRK
jgi:serine protease Do